MALPPPPKPGGGGGSSGGGSSGGGGGSSSGGGSSGRSSSSSSSRSSSRSSGSGGGGGFVPGVKLFGQPMTRPQYLQYKQQWNDMFRAWLGRPIREKELKQIINRGLSSYAVRQQLTQKKGFLRSPMYKTLTQQASEIVGFNYKPPRGVIRAALRSEGGLSPDSFRAALANNRIVRNKVTNSYQAVHGAETDYLAGAFGGGALTATQKQAVALDQSGLRKSTLGQTVMAALERAQRASERVFQGTLATPNTGVLQQRQQQQIQQPDLPA